MYAPKFRSWMTDWERFDESLDAKLDKMAEEIMVEIHAMVEAAMPKEPEPEPEYPFDYLAGLLQARHLPNIQQLQNAYPQYQYSTSGYNQIGNLFG